MHKEEEEAGDIQLMENACLQSLLVPLGRIFMRGFYSRVQRNQESIRFIENKKCYCKVHYCLVTAMYIAVNLVVLLL